MRGEISKGTSRLKGVRLLEKRPADVKDELAEVVSESELDPDVESESEELSSEEVSEVESEDDEDAVSSGDLGR